MVAKELMSSQRATQLPCGMCAPVYLAAVMEYLCAELLELGGDCARDNRRRYIQISDVYWAIEFDEELRGLVFGTEFATLGKVHFLRLKSVILT